MQIKNREFVFIILYAFTEFIPPLGGYDVAGSQWLYLSILNGVVTLYFMVKKINCDRMFLGSSLFFVYASFLLISALSFLASYNILESIVTYSRLLVCFITFINLFILIYRDTNILKNVFVLLGIIALFQSVEILVEFYINYNTASTLDEIAYGIKGNSGHKNILAASIVMKIPFLIYAVHISTRKKKVFFLASILVCFLAVFILNVRSSFLGILAEIGIYAVLVIVHYFNTQRKWAMLKDSFLMGGSLIAALLTSQVIISRAESNKSSEKYGTVVSRIKSMEFSQTGSSGRTIEWGNAWDFSKKHPVLGGGCGNWKIHNIPYEKHYQTGFIYNGRRVHNDFLETTADTGILGGLLYIGMFVCAIIYIIKLLKSRGLSLEIKMLLSTLLLSIAAYIIDALFNFPMERPAMQANLSIILSAILSLYLLFYLKSHNKADVILSPVNIAGFLLFLSMITVYFNYEVFKSMRALYMISYYWIKSNTNTWNEPWQGKIPFTAGEINPLFPWIPNIDGYGMPIACIKAKFLIDEQQYDEALKILNNDKRSNPYIYYAEYLRSIVAEKRNEYDSAYYYAKQAYYNRPANIDLFYFLYNLAVRRKDTTGMDSAFREITRWNFSPPFWCLQAQNLCQLTGHASQSLAIIEDGLKRFPVDSMLLYQKYFYTGFTYSQHGDYSNAIASFKEALTFKKYAAAYQNIADSYYNQRLYPEAINYFTAAIKTGTFRDGESEFLRGMCYKNMNRRDSACSDFHQAKYMGYDVNPLLLKECK